MVFRENLPECLAIKVSRCRDDGKGGVLYGLKEGPLLAEGFRAKNISKETGAFRLTGPPACIKVCLAYG